jgi:hypothetical protein
MNVAGAQAFALALGFALPCFLSFFLICCFRLRLLRLRAVDLPMVRFPFS